MGCGDCNDACRGLANDTVKASVEVLCYILLHSKIEDRRSYIFTMLGLDLYTEALTYKHVHT